MPRNTTIPDKPIRLRRKHAAEYLDVSERRIDYLISLGELPARKEGKSVFVMMRDLEAYANNQPTWEPAS